MATTYTGLTSTDGASLGTSLVQTAYDRLVEFKLRSIPQFRMIADKRPVQPTAPGSSVVFQLYNDLTPTTTALTESDDPDPQTIGSTSSVPVTLYEYGASTVTTRRLQLFALSEVDPAVADILAYHMADSLDVIVQTKLRSGTNLIAENSGSLVTNLTGGSPATGSVAATDVIKSRDIRMGVAKLRGQKVIPSRGEDYLLYLHPDVSHDLRTESGSSTAWRDAHIYAAPDMIWAGEVGRYENTYVIESPRCYAAKDGVGTAPNKAWVYRSYLLGKQALAEAVAEEPHTVISPQVDRLRRFSGIGWLGTLGWAIYRQEALIRIETSSSIAG